MSCIESEDDSTGGETDATGFIQSDSSLSEVEEAEEDAAPDPLAVAPEPTIMQALLSAPPNQDPSEWLSRFNIPPPTFVLSKSWLKTKWSVAFSSPTKLEESFQRSPFYVGPLGSNKAAQSQDESKRRYASGLQFLLQERPVIVTFAKLVDNIVTFVDGKHRFCLYRDMGLRCIPILVPKSQKRRFRRRFKPPKGTIKETRKRLKRWKSSKVVFDGEFWGKERPKSSPSIRASER